MGLASVLLGSRDNTTGMPDETSGDAPLDLKIRELRTLEGKPLSSTVFDGRSTRFIVCSHFGEREGLPGLRVLLDPNGPQKPDVVFVPGVVPSIMRHLASIVDPAKFAKEFLDGRPSTLVIIDHDGCTYTTEPCGLVARRPSSTYRTHNGLRLISRLLPSVQRTSPFKGHVWYQPQG